MVLGLDGTPPINRPHRSVACHESIKPQTRIGTTHFIHIATRQFHTTDRDGFSHTWPEGEEDHLVSCHLVFILPVAELRGTGQPFQ